MNPVKDIEDDITVLNTERLHLKQEISDTESTIMKLKLMISSTNVKQSVQEIITQHYPVFPKDSNDRAILYQIIAKELKIFTSEQVAGIIQETYKQDMLEDIKNIIDALYEKDDKGNYHA